MTRSSFVIISKLLYSDDLKTYNCLSLSSLVPSLVSSFQQKMKPSALLVHLQLALLLITTTAAVAVTPCQTKCGNITIDFPFGIGQPGCFLPGFNLTCNQSSTSSPKLYIGDGTYEATDILLAKGQVLIKSPVLKLYCNPGDSVQKSFNTVWSGLGDNGPYTFSNTRNSFITISCSVISYVTSFPIVSNISTSTSLCAAVCFDFTGVMKNNKTCSGIGCCQTDIGPGRTSFLVKIESIANQIVSDIGACTKAFLVDREWFRFDPIQLADNKFYSSDFKVPVVLDWAIPWRNPRNNLTSCAQAAKNQTTYACCSKNSMCEEKPSGYLCKCLPGFNGNPYIINGCQDIDECALDHNLCLTAICSNTLGSYSCHCPKGMQSIIDGDPRSGCSPQTSQISVGTTITLGGGVGLGVMIVLLTSLLLYRRFQQTNIKKRKEVCFRRNHGLLLQQLFNSMEYNVERTKIFTLEELEKATNKFDTSRILGHGGHGTVYKGMLSDQRVVAIKKSKIANQSEIEQFINEVAILSQINHRNVVKLYGCCLEDEVPLLVYEFISGGTLSDHIHVVGNHVSSLSFDDRLRIATEIAAALAYLHSAASISIFHRDIKTSNILLDQNLTAKVSDFGASRSIPSDKTRITTMVQGTFGYLDPEYYYTGQLTEKSDVYSFGVMLVELLTGEKVISQSLLKQEKNLVMHFIWSLEEDCLSQILDVRVAEEGREQEIKEVTILAESCLRMKGEERPTMKMVEQNLNRIKQRSDRSEAQQQKPTLQWQKYKEPEGLFNQLSRGKANGTTRSYSLEEEFKISLNYPR